MENLKGSYRFSLRTTEKVPKARRRNAVRCLLISMTIVVLGGPAYGTSPNREMDPLTKGNPRAGRMLVQRYGCVSCHEIKGIPNADGTVGPPLAKVRERSYVGGVVPNTANNMMQWIMHPRSFSPKTIMPELGVSKADARDIVAYLYSQ